MTISAEGKKHLTIPYSDQAYIVLLTIGAVALGPDVLHVCNYDVNITSNGQEYIAFPFDARLPSISDEGPIRASFVFSNVDRSIMQQIRTFTSPIDVTIEVVRSADPDTVEQTYSGFSITKFTGTVMEIQAELSLEDLDSEPIPGIDFVPAYFKAMNI